MNVIQFQAEHSPGYGKYWTVYIPASNTESVLPKDLKHQLGELFREDEFDLATDAFIGKEEKKTILAAIEKEGYFVEEKQLGLGLSQATDPEAPDTYDNDDVDLII